MVDALGSVVGTSNKDNTVNRRYQYKPYGTRLSASGTGSDPRFQWVGSPGYRTTDRSHSSHYVRARHYSQEEGRWTTVDPLLPIRIITPYIYGSGDPTNNVDHEGLCDCKVIVRRRTFSSLACAKGGNWEIVQTGGSDSGYGEGTVDPCRKCMAIPSPGCVPDSKCRWMCSGSQTVWAKQRHVRTSLNPLRYEFITECGTSKDDSGCPAPIDWQNMLLTIIGMIPGGSATGDVGSIIKDILGTAAPGCNEHIPLKQGRPVSYIDKSGKRRYCNEWELYTSIDLRYSCCDCPDITVIDPGNSVITFPPLHQEFILPPKKQR
ncbi:MAG: hypothetical protein HZC36_05185 [Armatimonadetes bacterium]|nr:hypothetical protein [Armatimonadota bacterium]